LLPTFHSAKPSEPPLPYPPPSPFVLLRAGDVDDQIGLLKPYYHNRIALLVASSAPSMAVPPAPLPGPVLRPSPLSANPSLPPSTLPPNQSASHGNMSNPPSSSVPSDLILPDDVPNPSQLKMSPIGQIMKSGGASGGTKKKGKVVVEGSVGGGGGGNVAAGATAAPPAPPAGPSAVPVAVGMSGTRLGESGAPKKKKGATGVGTGNGRKKTVPPLFPPPMVVR
jgi:transcriptional activator SPT7